MKKLKIVKEVTKIAVGVGVGHVLTNIAKNNTSSNAGLIIKGCVLVGTLFASSMVSDKVVDYTGQKIDETINEIKQTISGEEPIIVEG
jgi:hypothetical protein